MRSLDHRGTKLQQPSDRSYIHILRKPAGKEHPTHKPDFLKSGDRHTFDGKGTGEITPIPNLNPFNFSSISILPNQPAPVQAKLTINAPGDKYEQEADRIAEQVMRMENDSYPTFSHQNLSLQRKCAACKEEEDNNLMRKAESGGGIVAGPSLASQLNATKGSGMPLPPSTKGFMENSFGKDFSKVRLHADEKATEMNKGIKAKAFTHGTDIYFNQGEFRPQSSIGKRLLAHELVHTMQQASGLFRATVQREGDEKKTDEKKEVETKVEVVTEHDLSKDKTKAKATTTRSAEESIAKGVTATATEKTTEEGKTGTAEIKAKDKSTGLSVTGGIKAESPTDPLEADSAKGFIKVGGQWTLFDSKLKLESGLKTEFDFSKTPKVSADGKAVFLPNGVVSPQLAASMVFGEKGVSGKLDPSVSIRITKSLSAKAGVPIDIGPNGKLNAGVGVGIVLKFK